MTAAAFRVVEWVPAGVSIKTCAAPIIRALRAVHLRLLETPA
jgi:hypothetical protein